MGMDIHGKTIHVRMNWMLWSAMLRILKDNGFTGNLPGGNDGETVDKATARDVGRAVLKWWEAKADASHQQPQLESWESTILAYALLLAVDDGEAEHS